MFDAFSCRGSASPEFLQYIPEQGDGLGHGQTAAKCTGDGGCTNFSPFMRMVEETEKSPVAGAFHIAPRLDQHP